MLSGKSKCTLLRERERSILSYANTSSENLSVVRSILTHFIRPTGRLAFSLHARYLHTPIAASRALNEQKNSPHHQRQRGQLRSSTSSGGQPPTAREAPPGRFPNPGMDGDRSRPFEAAPPMRSTHDKNGRGTSEQREPGVLVERRTDGGALGQRSSGGSGGGGGGGGVGAAEASPRRPTSTTRQQRRRCSSPGSCTSSEGGG